MEKVLQFNLQRLRYERLSRRVTLDRVAKELGIHRSTYYKKENGDLKLSVNEFSQVLSILEIPQSEVSNFFN